MIKRDAILHQPMSNFAHGIDERHIVFRLRAARGNLSRCRLFYGDTACRVNPVVFSSVEMEVVATTDLFDWFEVTLKSPYRRVCYYFELTSGAETTLYYGDLFYDHVANERSEYYKLPYNRREDIADVPDWLKHAVIYNIFPDSFASGKREISLSPCEKELAGSPVRGKLGGTINGIRENLGYIAGLGFNCIYLNPIFAAGEYHKYDLLDYYKIDPCFGTNEDFRTLVSECHARGMRVIIDGVFNHCGWNFFAFQDVVEHGADSRYADWFYELNFPVVRPETGDEIPNYECFAYERLMPKLNTGNPEVNAYFQKVGTHWIEEYDIDGWRLDVADEVDHRFWMDFCRAVKAAKPDAAIIGEVWQSAPFWLDGRMFDSTMNYDMMKHCKRFFARGEIDAAAFDARVTDMRMRYRKNLTFGQLNLLDSHDVPRFLSLCGEDERRYRLAVLFLITFIGAPSVFYGDEQGIKGILEDDYRAPMRFDETELTAFFRDAIALRNAFSCLRTGEYRVLAAQKGLYAYERYDETAHIVITLNAQDESADGSELAAGGEILLSQGFDVQSLAPFGYFVART
ncbi:MAG: glycoside hydrolase family 13 protein [Clostridiaceae bacterium]